MRTTLAIDGGTPAISQPVLDSVPAWPPVYPGVTETLGEVYRSRAWSFGGAQEQQFSQAFADYHGAKHGVMMVNGTVTLECALAAAGVQRGDEVIVPGLTWMATAMAATYHGATAVFVDIDPDTLCLDATQLEEAITPKTKAIIPVHLYGSMADMDAIMAIADHHGIAVIEDCAHAHGGVWDGRGVGSIGLVGSFSFQQSKTLSSGEGGICITQNTEVASQLYRLKHIGYDQLTKQGEAQSGPPAGLVCHNYRGTEFQAVVLSAGLAHLREETQTRDANAQRLRDALEDVPGIKVQARGRLADTQGYYNLVFLVDPGCLTVTRDQFSAALGAEGLGCNHTYGPVYRHALWNIDPQGYRLAGDACPACEDCCTNRAMAINHNWLLGSDEVIDGIIRAVTKVARAYAA